ncbi:MAG TPA: GNAT family N-acetyltransferase [Candidatus Binatia bacterium]|nr:GNAT family N-acetyltransferase [Candidatus Binatia bacterium]
MTTQTRATRGSRVLSSTRSAARARLPFGGTEITTRSILPDEAGRFAALGDATIRDSLLATWDDGTSRPDWTLVAEVDGRPVARGALVAEPMGGGVSTLEGSAAFLWADLGHPDHPEAFGALMDGLAERLAPHGPTTLDRRLNPEVHTATGPMRGLLEASAFKLLQEKEGFAWTPEVPPPSPPTLLRVTTLAEAGRNAYRAVMSATTAGTLDRNDRYYIARCGPEPWAEEIMRALRESEEPGWLLGHHGEDPAGFVAVGSFSDTTWTIVHIGVVPEHRGHGHVSELLAAADATARARGYTAGLSEVDVDNAPMIAAMGRAGHRSDLRAWHVWHYRRPVPATRRGLLADGPVTADRPLE